MLFGHVFEHEWQDDKQTEIRTYRRPRAEAYVSNRKIGDRQYQWETFGEFSSESARR